jgi:hypothetical protein
LASAPAPRLGRSSDLPVSRPHVSYDGPISVGALLRREGRRTSHAIDRPVVPRARDVRNDESGGTAHGIAVTAGALLALSAVIGTSSAVGEVSQGTVSTGDQSVGVPQLGRGTAVIPAPAAASEAPPPLAAAVPPAAAALAALAGGAGVEPASGAGIVAQMLTPPVGSAGSAVSVSEADTGAAPVVRTATESTGSSEPGGSASQPLRNVISVPGPSNPSPVPAPSVPAPSVPAPSAPAPSAPAPAPAPSAPAPSAPASAAPAPSAPAPTDLAPSAPAPSFGAGGIGVPPRLVDELPPQVDGQGLVGRLPLVGGSGLVPAGEKDAPAEDRDGDLAEGDTDGATDPGTDAVGSEDEGSGGAVTDSATGDASADDETTDSTEKVAADGAEDAEEDTGEDAGTETESANSADGCSADTGSDATSDTAA